VKSLPNGRLFYWYWICNEFFKAIMRLLAISLILTLVAWSNAMGQSLEEITAITFTKQTRGLLDEVMISRDSVEGFVENHRMPENSHHYANAIDESQWAKLVMTLNDVQLEDIDGLQSPTMNRAHDGAIHSSIVIAFKDGKTVTHSFDDENPHPDLKPLLDVILEFRVPAAKE
jgi:hypothetical protein